MYLSELLGSCERRYSALVDRNKGRLINHEKMSILCRENSRRGDCMPLLWARLASTDLPADTILPINTVESVNTPTSAVIFTDTPAPTSTPFPAIKPLPRNTRVVLLPAPTSQPSTNNSASAICNDGTYSYSAHRRGTC